MSIIHEKDLQTLASYLYEYDNVGNRTQAIESVLQPDLPEGLMQLSIPEEIQPETPTPTATPEDTATPTLELTAEGPRTDLERSEWERGQVSQIKRQSS